MNARKKEFIKALAEFLAGQQAAKGIQLQMENQNPKPAPMVNFALEWAKLRQATPLHGYPSVSEAEQQLTKFLS